MASSRDWVSYTAGGLTSLCCYEIGKAASLPTLPNLTSLLVQPKIQLGRQTEGKCVQTGIKEELIGFGFFRRKLHELLVTFLTV